MSEQVPTDNENRSDKRSPRSGRPLKSNPPFPFACGGEVDDDNSGDWLANRLPVRWWKIKRI